MPSSLGFSARNRLKQRSCHGVVPHWPASKRRSRQTAIAPENQPAAAERTDPPNVRDVTVGRETPVHHSPSSTAGQRSVAQEATITNISQQQFGIAVIVRSKAASVQTWEP